MTHHAADGTRTIVAPLLAALILTAAQASAQSQQAAPSPSPRASTSPTTLGTVEGTVRKVDPMRGKVEVSSGLFGLFGTTLQVEPDTQIQAEGRQTSLTDIREGDKVKASYEIREGQSIRTLDTGHARSGGAQGIAAAFSSIRREAAAVSVRVEAETRS